MGRGKYFYRYLRNGESKKPDIIRLFDFPFLEENGGEEQDDGLLD